MKSAFDPLCRQAVLVTLLMFSAAGPARANPLGGTVTAGAATIAGQGSASVVIRQTTDRAIIHWNQFSIGKGELTTFVMPGVNSAVLNRVISGNMSTLLGTMSANGRVFLLNPNGILVGQGAAINTRGFVGSTLDLGPSREQGDAQFLRGGTLNFRGTSKAGVENQGVINTGSGDAILIGRQVKNSGSIQGGTVGLAAGDSVTLFDAGDARIQVNPSLDTAGGGGVGVDNQGLIQAVSAELKAAGGNMYSLAVNNGGTVRASRLVNEGGRIVLRSDGGKVQNSGVLDASATAPGGRGGEVQVLGSQVALINQARVDVSGDQGGGTALIGGDFQGKNAAVPNAQVTYLGKDALVTADALGNGNGGRVIVWSDVRTWFRGTISARGGARGGNGGFVEVSGKSLLDFVGGVRLDAPQGRGGTLLLDPRSITIRETGPDIDGSLTTATDDLTAVDQLDNAAGDFPDADSIITAAAVEGFLTTSGDALILSATEQVTVEAAIGDTTPIEGDLTLNAPTVNLFAPISLGTEGSVSGGAGTTTVNVGALGGTRGSIQNGIDVVAVGGTVTVAGGTYVGDVVVGATKTSLSLLDDLNAVTITGNLSVAPPQGGSGSITLGGEWNTSGTMQFDRPVALARNTTLGSAAVGGVTFASTVDSAVAGAAGLTVNAASTRFEGVVGAGTGPSGRLLALETDADGTTVIETTTVRADTVRFLDAVQLAQPEVTIDAAVSALFQGTVNSAAGVPSDLIVTSPTAQFGAAVGATEALIGLTVNGNAVVGGASVTTTAGQNYNGNLTLTAGAKALNGTTVAVDGNVVGGGSDLTVNGAAVLGDAQADTVAGLASLEVTGGTALNAASVTTTGDQTYSGTLTLQGGDKTLTATGAGGDIELAAVNGTDTGLTVSAPGTTTFGGAVQLGAGTLETGATGSAAVQSQVDAGNVTFNNPVTLGAGSAIAINTVAGDQEYVGLITLAGDVILSARNIDVANGVATSGNDLTLATTIGGAATVDGGIAGGGLLTTVGGGGAAVFSGSVAVDQAVFESEVTLQGASVTTSGSQTYQSTLTLAGGDSAVGSSGGTVTIGGDVVGGGNGLTVSGTAVLGDVDAGTDVVETFTGLSTLTVNGGTTLNAGEVSSTGAQTYSGDLTLSGGNKNLTGSSVAIGGDLTGGANALTITGDAVLGAAQADTIAASSLVVSGNTTLNAGTVNTGLGIQTYAGDLTLALGDKTLTAGTLGIDGSVVGNNHGLTINSAANLGGAQTDTLSGLASLTVNGSTTLAAGSVNTGTGAQAYNGDLTLSLGDKVLTGSAVEVDGNVAGGGNGLTIAGAATLGDAQTDTVGGLGSLTVNGAATLNAGSVTTSGAQDYNGNLTLALGNKTLSGTAVGVDGNVVGGGNALTVTGAATLGDAQADTVSGLASLQVDGNTTLNAGSVNTGTGAQDYNGDLTLAGGAKTLTASAARVDGNVVGGGNGLTVAGAATLGDAQTDTVAGLASLDVSGATTLNAASVTTTGDQTYGGTLALQGGNKALTATDAGGDITLAAVNGTDLGLTVTAPGTATFGGAVQLGAGALQTGASGTTVIESQVDAGSVTVNNASLLGAATAIAINTTAGNQSYLGQVTLAGDVTLSAQQINIDAGVSMAGHQLGLASTGTKSVTGNIAGGGVLETIAGGGAATFGGSIDVAQALFGTDIVLQGPSVTTSAAQNYDGNLTLAGTTDKVLTAPTISIDGNVVGGGRGLTLAGAAQLGDAQADTIGGLASLTVSGATTLNAASVDTGTGAQDYNGGLTLTGGSKTLTAGTVGIDGNTAGGGNGLTITGDTVLGAAQSDTVAGLASLTVNGNTVLNAGSVNTGTGAQDYNGNLTLALGNKTLTASAVGIDGNVVGGNNGLTIAGAAALGDDAADAVGGLTSLTVNGNTTLGAGSVNTGTGAQNYNGNLTLTGTGTKTLTASAVGIDGNVVGGGSGLAIVGTATLGDAQADTVGGLASLSVDGNTTLNAGSVTTSGAQDYNGNLTLAGGAKTLTGTIGIDGNVVGGGNALTAAGSVRFGDAVSDSVSGVSTLTVNGNATLNGAITTTGAQTYGRDVATTDDLVTLGSDVALTSSGNAAITFNARVDGPNSLSVATGGDTVFNDRIGSLAALRALTTTDSGGPDRTHLNVPGTVAAPSVITTQDQRYEDGLVLGANTVLQGRNFFYKSLTQNGFTYQTIAAGDIEFVDPYILTQDAILTTSGGQIIFRSTVDSDALATPRSLTVSTPQDTLFQGEVGGTAPLQSLRTDGGGRTIISGNVTTVEGQTYVDDVLIGGNLTLRSQNNAAIAFNGNLGSDATPRDLTIAGAAVLGDAATDLVGGLGSLTVNGATTINAGSVDTDVGAQNYNGTLTLAGGNKTLTGTVSVGGNLVGGGNELAVTGAATFGAAGQSHTVDGLTRLSVGGNTTLNAVAVNTGAGAQDYNGNLTLAGGAKTLTASAVGIDGNVVGGGSGLTIGGAAVLGDAQADTLTGLGSLTVNGNTTLNAGAVTSTGAQDYNGDLTLAGGAKTLTGSAVGIDGNVIGGNNALTVAGAATLGDAQTDTLNGLAGLTVNGTTTLNAGSVNTGGGAQNYNGDLTLAGGNKALTGAVSVGGNLIGGNNELAVTGAATLGAAGQSHNVAGLTRLTVDGNTTVNAVTVNTGAGSQDYNGNLTLAGAPKTLTAGTVAVDGDVVGGGSDLTIAGLAVLGDAQTDTLTGLGSLAVDGNTTLNAGAVTSTGAQNYNGDLTFVGGAKTLTASTVAIDGNLVGGDNALTVAGAAVFGDATADTVTGLSSLTVNGATTLNTAAINTGAGAQNYNGNLTLAGGAKTLTGSAVGVDGNVVGNDNALTIAGTATIGDAPADTATGLASLTINGDATVNAGTVTSTGAQDYNGNLTLGGGSVALNGSAVSIDGNVVGGTTGLTIAGAATLGDAQTDTLSGLASLAVNGNTTLNAGSVTTSGAQDYNGNLTLAGGAKTLTGGSVSVDGNLVGGANALTIAGAATLGDAQADTVSGLASLAINGATTLNAGTVDTGTGAQDYNGNLTLSGGAKTLTGSAVAIDGNVDGGANALTIAGAATLGDAQADAVTGLASLTVNGNTTINAGAVTSTGAQDYNGDLTLAGGAKTLTGSAVAIDGNVVGGNNALTIAGAATLGDAQADTVVGLASLTVNGATTLNAGSVNTGTGAQDYNGNLTLAGGAKTLTGSAIGIDGNVVGGNNALTIAGAATLGDAQADAVGGLASLAVNGATVLNAGAVTTTGAQDYNGNLTLAGGAKTLTGSAIGIDGNVVGGNNALTIAGAATLGDAQADTIGGLASLAVNGATVLNAGAVTTTGAQDYNGNLTLAGGAKTLTGSAVGIDGNVVGGNNALTIAGAATLGDAQADTVGGLASLTVNGATTLNAASVDTGTGAQDYNGNLTLAGGAKTLTGSAVGVDGNVVGGDNALTIAGAATLGDAQADTVGGLASLAVNGNTTLNAGSVTSTGAQDYNGNLTLAGGAKTLTGSAVGIDGNVVGGNNALTIAGAATLGDAQADTVAGLASLTVNGGTTLNAGSVNTGTGAQDYNGNLALAGGGKTLTGIVAVDGNLVGGNNTLAIAGTAILGDAQADTVGGLAGLTVDGNTTLNAGSVTTVGAQDYNGNLTLAGGAKTLSGGAIGIDGNVVGGDNALTAFGDVRFGDSLSDAVTGVSALAVQGNTIINGSITTTGAQTYGRDPATTDDRVTLASDVVLTSSGNETIVFNATVDGAHQLQVVTRGDTVFNDYVGSLEALARLETTASGGNAGRTFLNALGSVAKPTVRTSGDQVYRDVLELQQDTVLQGAEFQFSEVNQNGHAFATLTESDQIFSSPYVLTANTTLTSSGGQIIFQGAVDSDSTATPRSLVVNAFGDTVFQGDVGGTAPLESLETTGGGRTILGGNVTTRAGQTYHDDVQLANNVTTISQSGGPIVFNGSIASDATPRNLTVTGAATFGDAAADSLNNLAGLTVNGATTLNAGSVTAGTQNYLGNLTLAGGNKVLTGAVNVGGNVLGGNNGLSIVGAATLGDAQADTVSDLASLTVSGPTTLNAGSVSTGAGTQRYQGDLNLALGSKTLTGGSVQIDGSVAGGGQGLSIVGAATLGDAQADTVGGLASLTVQGATTLNAGSVTTTGAQDYSGDLTLAGGAKTLVGSTVGIDGNVAGGGNALTIAAAAVLGDDEADAVAGLAALTVEGLTTLNAGSVNTGTGAQTYGGNLSLAGGAKALTAGTVTVDGNLVGGNNALTISGAAVLGDAQADTVGDLASLVIGGATTLNAGSVTTAGTQDYQGNLTLAGGSKTLTGSAIGIDGNVVGGNNDLSLVGAVTLGDAQADTVGGLASLNVNGATTLNAGSVTTAGAQNYLGDLGLVGGNKTLNGAVNVAGNLVGGGNALAVAGSTVLGGAGQSHVVSGLSQLSVDGATTLNVAEVTTTGAQDYSGDLNLAGGAKTLTGSAISIDGNVAGGGVALTTVAGRTTFGDAQTDTVLDLGALSVSGATTLNAGSVDTGLGAQLYGGDLALVGGGKTLSGDTIQVDGNVLGGGNTLAIQGRATLGDAQADQVSGLSGLTVSGATTLRAGSVNSGTGDQTYGGDLNLAGGDKSLDGGAIGIDGNLVGGGNSLTIGGDARIGASGASSATDLANLTVEGTSTLNAGAITTAGNQDYVGSVTLGADTTLRSSGDGGGLRFGDTIVGGPLVNNLPTLAYNLTLDAAAIELGGDVSVRNLAFSRGEFASVDPALVDPISIRTADGLPLDTTLYQGPPGQSFTVFWNERLLTVNNGAISDVSASDIQRLSRATASLLQYLVPVRDVGEFSQYAELGAELDDVVIQAGDRFTRSFKVFADARSAAAGQ